MLEIASSPMVQASAERCWGQCMQSSLFNQFLVANIRDASLHVTLQTILLIKGKWPGSLLTSENASETGSRGRPCAGLVAVGLFVSSWQ